MSGDPDTVNQKAPQTWCFFCCLATLEEVRESFVPLRVKRCENENLFCSREEKELDSHRGFLLCFPPGSWPERFALQAAATYHFLDKVVV